MPLQFQTIQLPVQDPTGKTIAGQFNSVQIPQEGQIFKAPPGVGGIHKIEGGQVITLPENLFQGDVASLPEFHPDIAKQALGQRTPSIVTDSNQFLTGGLSVTKSTVPPIATSDAGVPVPPQLGTLDYQRQLEAQAKNLGINLPAVTDISGFKTPSVLTAPTASTGPAITSIANLTANADIKALEDKIKTQSAEIRAGLSGVDRTKILETEFQKYGLAEETKLVNDYNKRILEAQQRLRKIPDDIKTTLQDIGVTEAQLNRLIVKETQEPLETLRDVMELKGAAQDRINQSLKFVSLFADAELQDQAAKIEAVKYDLETNKDLLKRLDDKQQNLIKIALDQQKENLNLRQKLAIAGAPADVISKTVNLTPNEILSQFGTYLKKQTATETLSDFEAAFQRQNKRLPNVTELLEFKRLSGEAGRKPEAETTFTDKVINGRLVRIVAEKNTGKEISRTDLGSAGEITKTDRKGQFIQYLAQVSPNTKTRAELEKEAMSAGLTIDTDIKAGIDTVNKTSWLRRALGF